MFDDTKLSRAGTDSEGNAGILNPPVYRASTIHFPTIEAFDSRFERRFDDVVYGSYGTPTTKALESAVTEIENGSRSIALASGTAAITLSFMYLSRQRPRNCWEGGHMPSASSVETVIVSRSTDLGGFEVKRVLPSSRRRMPSLSWFGRGTTLCHLSRNGGFKPL